MNSLRGETPKISWFWGIVLSLSLHAIIFLLAIFWGFGSPNQLDEPQSIEGRLVSSSEIEQSIKENAGLGKNEEGIKAPQPAAKPEIPQESKKVEVKKETPRIKEEPKKAELKKEEPPPKVKEEKPKDVMALKP